MDKPKLMETIYSYAGMGPRYKNSFEGSRFFQPNHFRAIQQSRYYSKYGPARLRYKYRPFRYGFIRTAASRAAPSANFISAVSSQFQTRGFRQKSSLGDKYMLVNYRSRMPRAAPSKFSQPRLPNKKAVRNRKNKTAKKASRKFSKYKTPNSNVKALANQVKDIRKAIHQDRSTHTHKYAMSGLVTALATECDHAVVDAVTPNYLEAYTDNLRYFDPSAPGVLVTADPTTASYSHDLEFKNIYSRLRIRNNYLIPCHVRVYLCKSKSDTNNSPLTEYTAGIADQVVSAGVDTETALLYLNDIERVKEQWNIDCVVDKVLNAGQEAITTHSTGSFKYDASHYDTEAIAYQKQWKAYCYVIRLEGVLGHDTGVGAEQGILPCKVDYDMVVKAEIVYDAGVNLNDISINDARDSFTNGGVASVYSIPDNIAQSAT